jgi:hypothetical protein
MSGNLTKPVGPTDFVENLVGWQCTPAKATPGRSRSLIGRSEGEECANVCTHGFHCCAHVCTTDTKCKTKGDKEDIASTTLISASPLLPLIGIAIILSPIGL